MTDLTTEVTSNIVHAARFTKIETAGDAQAATSFVQDVVRPLRRKIDDAFDPIIDSAKETVTEAQKQKNTLEAPLLSIEKSIKGAIVDYNTKFYVEQRKVVEKNTEKAIAAGVDSYGTPVPVDQEPLPIMQKIKGLSIQERMDFAIDDDAKIPREYLTADLRKIKEAVLKTGRRTQIPGVRVFEKPSITIR